MRELREYVAAVYAESRGIFTGSAIAMALSFVGLFGYTVPGASLFAVFLGGGVWATFRAWKRERRHRIAAEGGLLAEAPVVLVTYDGPGTKEMDERVTVRNTSRAEALNVELLSVQWQGVTVSFPRLAELAPDQEVVLDPRFARDKEPVPNRIHSVLMVGVRDAPIEKRDARPIQIAFEVRYTNRTGVPFRCVSEYDYVWQAGEARVRRISGVQAIAAGG